MPRGYGCDGGGPLHPYSGTDGSQTCMGLFLSRNLFLVFAGSLFGAESRSSSRRLRSGSRSARKVSRDRNASAA